MSTTLRPNQLKSPEYRIPRDELHKYGLMPSDRNSNGVCPKSATDSCPSGHQLKQCKTGQGFFCEQCSDKTFQPNENWMGDKCRLRRNCRKANMYYLDEGSTTRNANCACIDGYHFPNEDQRACFSNPICQKGYAPGMYGNCESCQKKGMFSDTVGRVKKCKPLTNCEKRGRCTDVKSNGQFDNICGPKVTDLSTCKEIEPSSSSSDVLKIAIPAGIIGALLLIILFIFFVRRKKYRRQQSSKRVLTVEEMDELKLRITKASDRDPAVCKKVLTTSCSFIEERIERQIWDLARELFRPHHIDGKYELIVDKYKESQAKYTVNGYLLEWRDWRGDSKDAVAELFRCLRQVKRDDIINEICACLRNDIEFSEDSQRQSRHSSNKKSMRDECVYIFFPCCYGGKEKSSSSSSSSSSSHSSGAAVVVEADAGEAGTKLLAYPTDDIDEGSDSAGGDGGQRTAPGTFYRSHPSPSAPELDEPSGGGGGFPSLDNVKYNRQFSQPVQATS